MFEEFSGSGSVDVAKGLEIAAELERKSITYYKTKALGVGLTAGRKLFEFLEGEERKHLKAVNEAASALAGGAADWKGSASLIAPAIFRGFEERRVSEIPLQEVVVNAAMDAERESREFYLKFAESVAEPEGKRFFLALAGFEARHLEMLGELLELGKEPVDSAGAPEDFR